MDLSKPTIEQKAIAMLQGNAVLIEVLKSRNTYGLKKYGKSLDDNKIPFSSRAIHLIQELMDAGQYATWVSDYDKTYLEISEGLFSLAKHVQHDFCLTAQEIIDGGKK